MWHKQITIIQVSEDVWTSPEYQSFYSLNSQGEKAFFT